ncbi:hypothetical protein AAMO2058_000218700 [Amorphochlora amoebiformis]
MGNRRVPSLGGRCRVRADFIIFSIVLFVTAEYALRPRASHPSHENTSIDTESLTIAKEKHDGNQGESSKAFTPNTRLSEQYIGSEHKSMSEKEDIIRLHAYLHSLQFPKSCENRGLVHWAGGFSGYGSQISILLRTFVNAVIGGYTTIVGGGYHGKHSYVSRERCNNRTITGCIYKELSSCYRPIRGTRRVVVDPEDCRGWTPGNFTKIASNAGIMRGYPINWYVSQMLRWLMTPNEALRIEINRLVSKHYPDQPKYTWKMPPAGSGIPPGRLNLTLCVHVRHGDRKESSQYPDSKYAAVINQAVMSHGFGRVEMMSDDPVSYTNLQKLVKVPISFLPLSYFAVVNYTGSRQHAANIVWERQIYNRSNGVTWDEGLLFSAIFEIWTQKCDGLIGNFKSSFPSILYFLRMAYKPYDFVFDMDRGTGPSICINHMAPLPWGHLTDPFGRSIQDIKAKGWGGVPKWNEETRWW